MRTGTIASIRAVENGVIVCVTDPVIVKKNRSSKGIYQSPEKDYTFPNLKKALKWIGDNESKLMPDANDDEYGSTFGTISGD